MLFADDTTIYLSNLNTDTILTNISIDLITINNWLTNNRLIINWSKTNAMFLKPTNYNQKKNPTIIPSLKFGTFSLAFVNSTKLLGVLIDNKLKFHSQVDTVCKKINSKTFLLSKSLFLFPASFRFNLFKLFILPHIDYCSSLYLHLSSQTVKTRLDRCFGKAVSRLLKIL